LSVCEAWTHVSAFDFLDISQLEVSRVVYLSLAITVAFTILSLLIAWVWRRYRG
jgi:hypothetical protein